MNVWFTYVRVHLSDLFYQVVGRHVCHSMKERTYFKRFSIVSLLGLYLYIATNPFHPLARTLRCRLTIWFAPALWYNACRKIFYVLFIDKKINIALFSCRQQTQHPEYSLQTVRCSDLWVWSLGKFLLSYLISTTSAEGTGNARKKINIRTSLHNTLPAPLCSCYRSA